MICRMTTINILSVTGYDFCKYGHWIEGVMYFVSMTLEYKRFTEFVNKKGKAKIASQVIMNPHDMSHDDNKYFIIEEFT